MKKDTTTTILTYVQIANFWTSSRLGQVLRSAFLELLEQKNRLQSLKQQYQSTERRN